MQVFFDLSKDHLCPVIQLYYEMQLITLLHQDNLCMRPSRASEGNFCISAFLHSKPAISFIIFAGTSAIFSV